MGEKADQVKPLAANGAEPVSFSEFIGDAREQFHTNTQRTTQPHGASFREKQGDTKTERYRDQERDRCAYDGAINRNQRAKVVINNIPLDLGEEPKTKPLQGWPSPYEQGHDDAEQSQQNRRCEELGDPVEEQIFPALTPNNRHAARVFENRITGGL